MYLSEAIFKISRLAGCGKTLVISVPSKSIGKTLSPPSRGRCTMGGWVSKQVGHIQLSLTGGVVRNPYPVNPSGNT